MAIHHCSFLLATTVIIIRYCVASVLRSLRTQRKVRQHADHRHRHADRDGLGHAGGAFHHAFQHPPAVDTVSRAVEVGGNAVRRGLVEETDFRHGGEGGLSLLLLEREL